MDFPVNNDDSATESQLRIPGTFRIAPEIAERPEPLPAPSPFVPVEEPTAPALKPPEPVGDPASGVFVIPLFRPIVINGKPVSTLTLDIGALSEPDLANIDDEMRTQGDPSPRNVVFSSSYCMRIAARACGVNYHELKALSFKDSMKIQNQVQNFLVS